MLQPSYFHLLNFHKTGVRTLHKTHPGHPSPGPRAPKTIKDECRVGMDTPLYPPRLNPSLGTQKAHLESWLGDKSWFR